MNRNGKHSEFPLAINADGDEYLSHKTFFFFDSDIQEIRNTNGLRRVDSESVGSLGYPVVRIDQLRTTKDAAIADGQKVLLGEIERLRELVRRLETEKSPSKRSLKSVLMAG